MAKFRYRMQNILDIKFKLEEQAKMEYAAANMKYQEELEKLQVLYDRRTGYEQEARTLRVHMLKIRDIQDNQIAMKLIKEYIGEQLVQVKIAEDNLEMARERLTEMMKDRKTHEKLKEKAFEQFLQDENARESKEIDELTSYRHGKKIDR